MATIHVRDHTYHRLAQRAADEKTTVDDLVQPVLDKLAGPAPAKESEQAAWADKRRNAFKEWMTLARQRANRYPPGFVADDSRESIYAGRGERTDRLTPTSSPGSPSQPIHNSPSY